MNRMLRREKTSGAPLFWATLMMVICLVGAIMTAESRKPTVQSDTKFCWVGWTSDDIWSDVAANSAMLNTDGTLPLVKLESVAQLNSFRTHLTGNGLTVTDKYDEIASFDEAVASYDDAFFADKILLAVYVSEGSGSIRHEFAGWDTHNKTAVVQISSVSGGDTSTEDMAGWLALIPAVRSELANYTAFDAVRVTK
ncbi:MAG: hypothetical protein IJY28_03020 [Clostridia bacterium]|nr:hypothetical protein [Clostridia bacterium]